MQPLAIPTTLPEYAQQYLALLDEAVRKTVADASVSSASYREAAALYRQTGNAWKATEADDTADRIDLDPRLHVAGVMHNATADGTAKHMLHVYIGLIEEQALARRGIRALISISRKSAA
jgi:hypothetical protein